MALKLTSSAFEHNGDMPALYTCDGRDISPPLTWTGVPANAKSLVLIVDDPDAPDPAAPRMTFVHWLLYNLPPSEGSLPAGAKASDLPPGTLLGRTDFGRTGYGGPCPPIGKHRYFFKLYALDTMLPDLKTPTKSDLLKAMNGHVIEQTELIGLYKRPR